MSDYLIIKIPLTEDQSGDDAAWGAELMADAPVFLESLAAKMRADEISSAISVDIQVDTSGVPSGPWTTENIPSGFQNPTRVMPPTVLPPEGSKS